MSTNGKKKDKSPFEALFEALKERSDRYKNLQEAKSWLEKNYERIQVLYENIRLRDFVFEPFKDVLNTPPNAMDSHVYSVITQVAIINAVLAGLPGRMGVGVYVAIALEGWMAYVIARRVGIKINSVSDIWKYVGLLAATVITILYFFRSLLGFGISLFSFVPVNPFVLAEFFVTDFVGVLFFIGFKEAKSHGSFRIPMRMMKEAITTTKALFTHQYGLLRNILSIKNIKTVAGRAATYLRGDIPFNMRQVNGDFFATTAMAYLMAGESHKLEGPLGEAFLEAIRLRWSAQLGSDSTLDEIAALFSEYDPEQLEGAINTIKGKMFEVMVTDAENQDGDRWQAVMHTDESFPGSDIIFTDNGTGEQLEVSLKAVAEQNTEIIESALVKYPDLPIMTTDEVARIFGDNFLVFGSGLSNDILHNITKQNVEQLIDAIEPVNPHQVIIGGVTVGTTTALWPFVMAYLKGNISEDQLRQVCKHVLGKAGIALTSRLVYATLFGPVFAWYLLARGVMGIVSMVEPGQKLCMEYKPTRP